MEIQQNSPPRTVGVPIGERVALNIKRLRDERGLTQPQLTQVLEQTGMKFARGAVSKIEKGQRQIDPDELVAFALALKTTPNELMFGVEKRRDEFSFGVKYDLERIRIALTQDIEEEKVRVWKWAIGEEPLGASTGREKYDFQRRNRPHEPTALPSDAEFPDEVWNSEPMKALKAAYKDAAAYSANDPRVLEAIMAELPRIVRPPATLDEIFGGHDIFASAKEQGIDFDA